MCVKCIIDGTALEASAKFMAERSRGWQKTIDALFSGRVEPLTDEEHQEIVNLSDDYCSYAEQILKQAKDLDYRLRKIAIAHSWHPDEEAE